jgi:hypothetical protein
MPIEACAPEIKPPGAPRETAAKPGVVAILPRGEAIRNFVYTGCLEQLAHNVRLTVLSVMPDESCFDSLAGCGASLVPLREAPERWIVLALREVLDIAHGRWLWSQAAQHRWERRNFEASRPLRRLKLSAKRLLAYPFAHPAGLDWLSKVDRAWSRRFRTTEEYTRLFRELRPALVFNGSHVHSRQAIQAVQAAQWLHIPTAAFIFSWDNLTSQGRIIPPYDYYLVWNERIRKDLLRLYRDIRPDRVLVTGTPQFDFHFRPEFYWSREEFCSKIGADPARPIILYSTGMANHMPGEERIVEGVADMARDMKQFGPPQLLVRLYPKDQTGRFEQLKQRRKDILFPVIPWEKAFLTPKREDLYLLTNMLRHCAAGVNIASTISLELCMLDKPVINVGYDPPGLNIAPISFARYYRFDHYAPVVSSGAVEVARSENELRALLFGALQNPARLAARRAALIREMFGCTLDGFSSRRVAEQLGKLAAASHDCCSSSA